MNWAEITPFLVALTMIGSMLASVWYVRGWISTEFTKMKSSTYEKLDKMEENILTKLEYHERHDDTRFETLGNRIWELRLRLADSKKKMNGENENK